jgi:hypothetical protein
MTIETSHLLADSALAGSATVKAKVIVGWLLLTGVLAAGVGALAPHPVAKWLFGKISGTFSTIFELGVLF